MNEPAYDLRSFGRIRGRKLSARQDALLRDLLPKVAVDPARPLAGRTGAISLPAAQSRPLWLEIGFGGGEHLVWQARHHTDADLIGCEPYVEGVVKVLSAIREERLGNVRIHAGDARDVLRCLPDASVGRAFVLFPDPWPKKRHVKRRLINVDTLQLLARVMRPGAELRLATDIGDYARTMLLALAAVPDLVWTAQSALDWRERPADWPQTRYEAKANRVGRRCMYLRIIRAS